VYLLGRRFEEIDWATLERARAEKTEESRTLDFKRDLPDLTSRDSKRDFLEDVCAFANASGGVLLYGVDEARDENTKLGHIENLPGTPTDAMSADFKSKVQELVRSSFDPRFAGVVLDWIDSPDGKTRILKIGVERSPVAPHRVTSNGSREFMLRSMTSSERMDAEQIREAVRRSINASEIARERLVTLSVAAAENRMKEHATLWGCAVPAFRTTLPQPIGDPIVRAALSKLRDTHDLSGLRIRYDHLGASLSLWEKPFSVLDRVHRDGTIEHFDFVPVVTPSRFSDAPEGKRWLHDRFLADSLAKLAQVMAGLRSSVGVGGPMLVIVALFGIHGMTLEQIYAPTQSGGGRGPGEPTRAIGVDPLLLEPTETTDEFLGRVVKSAADLFWNAGGHPFCGGIDAEGNRTAGIA